MNFKICSGLLLLLPTFHAGATCRSQAVVREFLKQKGFTTHPKGFVVDHTCALENGGLDIPGNMQLQTIAEGKAKDRWERTPEGKRKTCNIYNSLPERTVFNCKEN